MEQVSRDIQQKLSAFDANDLRQRKSLLQSARALIDVLETPGDKISRMIFSQPYAAAATRTLVDLKVFSLLADAEGPQTVEQLARHTKADPKLLSRLLQHLASEHVVTESGADQYVANDLVRALATPGGEGALCDLWNGWSLTGDLPAFLKDTNYANPIDKDHTLWKYSKKTDLHYFDYIFTPGREEMAKAFKNHMSFIHHEHRWFQDEDVFQEIFGNEDFSDQDVLMIDIGGNAGHDILGFKRANSSLSGRLILQDLPGIVETLDSSDLASQGVEVMTHDMFTPQPVKQAKAYFLKYILHDWPDEQCVKTLTQLKPALKPGYSRILLNEIVVPDVHADWNETGMDMLMMGAHSASERRASEWKRLIESVDGLKVRKIWDISGMLEKIIEIEVV